jgi:hypothetical protein
MVDDMIREWYCMMGERLEGPFTLQELRRMSESGALGPDNMVRKGEAGTWVAARSLIEPRLERQASPAPASAFDVSREREPRLTLDAPVSEWGVAALVLGSALLLATPLSNNIVMQIHAANGSRFISFLLTFMMEALLLVGNGASVAFGVLGLLGYFKQRQRLPLNLAGAVVSALSLFLWLLNAVVLIRAADR